MLRAIVMPLYFGLRDDTRFLSKFVTVGASMWIYCFFPCEMELACLVIKINCIVKEDKSR